MAKQTKLFFKSKVRKYVRDKGFRVSSEVIDGNKLDQVIKSILDRAVYRTKANRRKTVKPIDAYIRILIPIPDINQKILDKLLSELKGSGIDKRGLMYYDIVTHIIRHKHEEPEYDQIMLWCNANIKNGKTFLD